MLLEDIVKFETKSQKETKTKESAKKEKVKALKKEMKKQKSFFDVSGRRRGMHAVK